MPFSFSITPSLFFTKWVTNIIKSKLLLRNVSANKTLLNVLFGSLWWRYPPKSLDAPWNHSKAIQSWAKVSGTSRYFRATSTWNVRLCRLTWPGWTYIHRLAVSICTSLPTRAKPVTPKELAGTDEYGVPGSRGGGGEGAEGSEWRGVSGREGGEERGSVDRRLRKPLHHAPGASEPGFIPPPARQ